MALLVVGGSGFAGRAVCRRAVQRGIPVISLSRSGRPEDVMSSWTDAVDWREGNAADPEVVRSLVKDCKGVISTVGTMVDSTWPVGARQMYLNLKKNFQSGKGLGNMPGGGLGGLATLFAGGAPDLGTNERESATSSDGEDTYEALNRDVHLVVASEAAGSKETESFVYFSAVPPNVVNSKIPLVQRYFSTKMETEMALAQYEPEELRCTILRPTVMYDDENLHTLAPAAISKLSSLLDSLIFARFGFRDVPHLLPTPPIFVDTVADCAIEAALDRTIDGILDVKDITRVAHASGGGS